MNLLARMTELWQVPGKVQAQILRAAKKLSPLKKVLPKKPATGSAGDLVPPPVFLTDTFSACQGMVSLLRSTR